MAASSLDNSHFTDARNSTPQSPTRLGLEKSVIPRSRIAIVAIGLGLTAPSAWSIGAISDMNKANAMATVAIERGSISPAELDEINSKIIPGFTDLPLAKKRYLETLPPHDVKEKFGVAASEAMRLTR